MPYLDISPRARGDLDDIFDYGVTNFGAAQADAYARQLATALNRLIEFPEMAPLVERRSDGSRRLNSGSHVVIYRIERDRLHIARVLHQRMDPERHP